MQCETLIVHLNKLCIHLITTEMKKQEGLCPEKAVAHQSFIRYGCKSSHPHHNLCHFTSKVLRAQSQIVNVLLCQPSSLFMHMHIPLSCPEFPLQPSPSLTEASKNGRKFKARLWQQTSHWRRAPLMRPMLLGGLFVSTERSTLYKINHPSSSRLRLCTTR